jgi:phospholipase/carboxylesterase
LLFVQAPLIDSIGGYSWWDISDIENKSAQQDASLELITIFLKKFLKQEGLEPEFVAAIGFSQGAAMISMLAQEDPKQFRAIALLSGFIIKHHVSPSTQKPSVLVVHGTLDEIVPLSKLNLGIEHLRSNNFHVTLHTEEVGHKIGIQGMRLLKEWAATL